MPTLGRSIEQVLELEARAAVYRALASYLRTRYLSRDSTSAAFTLKTLAGAAVPETVVQLVAVELEADAEAEESTVKAAKAQEVGDARKS